MFFVFPAVFHVYLMVRFMCFMPHIMWTNAMYPLSAPLWQLTCPRAHTHHLHNIIRTFSLIRINERSVFRPPESNVRLYNTLRIHVIRCCRRCNNLKRKKVDLVRPFEKWFVTTIKVTRYNNLQKKEESSSATKKYGSREFKKYKNAKKQRNAKKWRSACLAEIK